MRARAAAALLLALAAWWTPVLAVRHARPVLLDLGPNDADYVRGFREDWERDGRTRFHWAGPVAEFRLPLRLIGDGHVLRMRVRRHFVEPSHVRLTIEGRTAAVFDIQADPKVPYRTLEFALPNLEGRGPFVMSLQAASENASPWSLAFDWLEIERRGPDARFTPVASTRLFVLIAVMVALLAPALAGLDLRWAAAHAVAVLGAASWGFHQDVLAAERIFREGIGAYAAVGMLSLGLVRWPRGRRVLGISRPWAAGGLVLLVLVGLGLRLAILLPPRFYYPDVRVHAQFAWELGRRGLFTFLRRFTENQYRYSLGLQLENGHWYAFPYPPVFYVLCWPLVRFGFRPEVAVSLLAAVVNSLEAILVFGIARRLERPEGLALGAAAAVPVLPLFIARLSLAYFPALVGHGVDAVVILYLVAHLDQLHRRRVVLTLGALLAAALLTYTQSLLNFAVLLSLFLALQVGFDRTGEGRSRQLGLVAAGALGAALSLALFYGRYVPILLDMRRGIPMAEERVLLDKQEQQARQAAMAGEPLPPPEPEEDPYTGPHADVGRGLRKAAWRLYVFYGLFAPVVVAGVLLAWRRTAQPDAARFVAAWALTYLALNLASGALPGPNLVRYNKDLEVIAPLCCLGLASVGAWLWTLTRAAALAYGAAFWAFGLLRTRGYFLEKLFLER
ncbi:MAG TPA: hypothetical protein VGN09_08185 [Vicinamibacteria bacterium]